MYQNGNYKKRFLKILLFSLSLTLIHCGPAEFYFNSGENSALDDSPFDRFPEVPAPFDPNKHLTGVDSLFDSVTPANPFLASSEDEVTFVRRCRPEDYEIERQEALAAAANDPENQTIPVRFAISTGDKMDETAHFAHLRSILRSDDDGETLVYIGPHNAFKYRNNHGAKHYITDHTSARDAYIKGERCFFSTIKVKQLVSGEIRLNNSYNHNWAILHYGNKYTGSNSRDKHLSPRLFQRIEDQATPQIIPLYVADLRDKIVPSATGTRGLLNDQFASSASRRKEYEVPLKKLFYLDHLFERRHSFLSELSFDRSVPGDSGQVYKISGYDGVPQLIDNIIFGFKGTVLGIQYTPIVLDLGRPKIRTSSVHWGSFFNMANLKFVDPIRSDEKISHMTAWVGGYLKDHGDSDTAFWQREAEDGLLVFLDEGETEDDVKASDHLFGQSLEIDGKTYKNGFEALRALTNKRCDSENVKERYVSIWDDAYTERLRVWIDRNRNGVIDKELDEVKTLVEAGVAAISACNVVDKETEDSFGNLTHLRAPFVFAPDLIEGIESEEDVLRRIREGVDLNGKAAEFRVMIDIFFQTHPLKILQDIDAEEINLPEELLNAGTTENDLTAPVLVD